MLTLIDCLLSEYPWPAFTDKRGNFRGPEMYVVLRLPLARAFALFAAIQPRYGVEPKGPTYVEKAMINARRKAESSTPS